MINKIFKRLFNRYSNIFKFLFYIKYLFLIFFIATLIFLLIPKFFDYEKKQIYIKNYLNNNYNLNIKENEKVEDIENIVIWGNHSTTQVPDLYNCKVSSKNINLDHGWIHETFIPRVQKRGGEIIEFRGLSSAASAASAIYDHIYVLENGSSDWEALGVLSSGKYNITPDIMFSFPVVVDGGSYKIKDDINIHQSLSESLKVTEEELIKEREIVKKYLP